MKLALKVTGEKACFRRPECREDFISYDVMTPLAALRLLEGFDQQPGNPWTVDHIDVLRPIRFGWIGSSSGAGLPTRRINALIDVEYIIHAQRMGDKRGSDCLSGAPSSPAFLGLRECSATVSILDPSIPLPQSTLATPMRDLGWMLYDLRGTGQSKARFFRAELIDGRLNIPVPQKADLAA